MMRRISLVLLACLCASLVGVATSTEPPAVASAQDVATRTPLPRANEQPDRCEQNNEREAACNIPLDQVTGPYTFLPDGDQDWYRVDLGAPTGLRSTLFVRGTPALDLRVSISRDDGTPITTFESPAISTTLQADVAGPVVLRVENRSPASAVGASYNIEIRKTLPPAPTALLGGVGIEQPTPDALENNYDPAHTAPIAVGVVYDLNLTCPVQSGCGGGDHDYLAIPVKAGTGYLVATFDLGPGVDTVLDLFWGDETTPTASSDDYGSGMLSVLQWTAPDNGVAVVRVGPRNGGTRPLVLDDGHGTFRFAVAAASSPFATELRARLDEQGAIPTPTATRAPAPAEPGAANQTALSGQAGAGTAGRTVPAAPQTNPVIVVPSATPTATAVGESTYAIDVVELTEPTPELPTPLPRIAVPLQARIGYDRNANKVLDVDEGISGLTVYVANAQGVLLGQALTDRTGGVQLTVRARAEEQLTVSVPYFAAAQVISAQSPQVQPIIVAQNAPLPGILP